MNAEQLNSARLARWSQNGEARLTLEAASEWLDEIGFCPYMPMGLTGVAPAPSFLEAVVGRPAESPSPGERKRSLELVARLIENSAAVPLKLGSSLGEQPDFVASPDVLRYLYALCGDRNFKTGPLTVGNEKVTPLSLHCWEAIQERGPLDVAALQPILGRDITEAAIARALQELWNGMYIFPILSATGQPAQWELIFRRFPKPVAAGASTGHAEAQSAMISLYLQASVAAREEEILAFLSPLAAQSKLREVIRGLGSMRQLDILDIDGRAHVALQGGLLPEMVAQLSEEFLAANDTVADGEPEIAMEAELESEAEDQDDMKNQDDQIDSGIVIEAVPPSSKRPWQSQALDDSDRPARTAIKKFVPRSGDSSRPAPRKFAARDAEERGPSRPTGSRDREPVAPKGYAARGRGMGERAKRWEKSGEVPEAPTSGSKPFAPRTPGFKPSGFKSAGFKPGGSKFGGGSKSFGAKRPGSKFGASKFGAPKPWQSRSSAEGTSEDRPKPWKKFDGAGDSRSSSGTGTGKPYAARSAGPRSSGFKPRTAGKPWAARPSSDGESFPRRPREGGPREAGDRPKPWQRAGAGARPIGRKPFGKKPSGFTASGFKSAGSRSAESRSDEPRESRPAAAGTKPWVSRGAESRVGSKKSYAARSAAKPYAKAGGAKPWAKRSSAAPGGEDVRPKRRPESEERSEGSPRKQSDAKPFWSKNPRGGKGSTAASRTNRPHGKKGGKKGGKKK